MCRPARGAATFGVLRTLDTPSSLTRRGIGARSAKLTHSRRRSRARRRSQGAILHRSRRRRRCRRRIVSATANRRGRLHHSTDAPASVRCLRTQAGAQQPISSLARCSASCQPGDQKQASLLSTSLFGVSKTLSPSTCTSMMSPLLCAALCPPSPIYGRSASSGNSFAAHSGQRPCVNTASEWALM
jgi:hypothetical protein